MTPNVPPLPFQTPRIVHAVYGILTLLGGLWCVYLVTLHVNSDGGKLCELVGTDCVVVIHSAYGTLGGFSTASLGLGYFLIQFLIWIGFQNASPETRPSQAGLALLLSSVGAAASLYYIYVLRLILHQGCLACYAVHGINAALLALGFWQLWRLRNTLSWQALTGIIRDVRTQTVVLIAVAIAGWAVFAANLLITRHQLTLTQEKIRTNLPYFFYLYDTAPRHAFEIHPDDHVVGEKGIAVHQIVVFFKDGCGYCHTAIDTLTPLVAAHDTAAYLLLKNIRHLTPEARQQLEITRVPAIFIDGKRALGWDVPGFLDRFIEDCGC